MQIRAQKHHSGRNVTIKVKLREWHKKMAMNKDMQIAGIQKECQQWCGHQISPIRGILNSCQMRKMQTRIEGRRLIETEDVGPKTKTQRTCNRVCRKNTQTKNCFRSCSYFCWSHFEAYNLGMKFRTHFVDFFFYFLKCNTFKTLKTYQVTYQHVKSAWGVDSSHMTWN